MNKFVLAILACTAVTLTSAGCSADETPNFAFKDPTGLCFRRIAWSENGQTNSRYEIVLAKQSSSLIKDMKRLRDIEDGHMVKSPDLIPFEWYGAWIDDDHASDEDGPDCSALPVIHEQSQ